MTRTNLGFMLLAAFTTAANASCANADAGILQPNAADPSETSIDTLPTEREQRGEVEEPRPTEAVAAPGTQVPHEPFVKAFEREGRDRSWSGSFEKHIADTMRFFPDSEPKSAECRSTVCKLVVTHTSVEAGARWSRGFAGKLMARENDPIGMAYQSRLDETMLSHTWYGTRPGYGEPHPDGTPRLTKR